MSAVIQLPLLFEYRTQTGTTTPFFLIVAEEPVGVLLAATTMLKPAYKKEYIYVGRVLLHLYIENCGKLSKCYLVYFANDNKLSKWYLVYENC